MAELQPNPPTHVASETGTQPHFVVGIHMSDTSANAMIQTAKYTYTIPARQETYRLLIALIFVGVCLFVLLPKFFASSPTNTQIVVVIVAVVGIVAGEPILKAVLKALKGGD